MPPSPASSMSSSSSSSSSPFTKFLTIFIVVCTFVLLLNIWYLTRRTSHALNYGLDDGELTHPTSQQLLSELKEKQTALQLETNRRRTLEEDLKRTSNYYQTLQSDYLSLKEKLSSQSTSALTSDSEQNKKAKLPFTLEIKVLTFDRLRSFQRCLDSFKNAFYDEDMVDLFIFIDHFSPGVNMTRAKHDEQLQINQKILQYAKDFHWPFGKKHIHYRQSNSHLQFQWIESWYPLNDDTYAFVAEDDIVVSPYWYQYMKKLLLKYRYGDKPRDPYMYGISFQKQTLIPGHGHGIKRIIISNGNQPYLYNLIGTWGQLLFPEAWRDFRKYYDDRRYLSNDYKPYVGGLVTNDWYKYKGEKLWTPWIIRWAMAKGMYNMYPNFGSYALSASYRDPGVNYGKTLGPDHPLISTKNEPRFNARFLNAELPSVNNMLRFDYCFRQVPRGKWINATSTANTSDATSLKTIMVVGDHKYLYNQLCTCEQVISRSFESICRQNVHFYVGSDEKLARDISNRGFTAILNIGATLAQYLKRINANAPVLMMNQDNRVLLTDADFTKFSSGTNLSGITTDSASIYLETPGLLGGDILDDSLNSVTTIAHYLKPLFPATLELSFQRNASKEEDLVIKSHDYGCLFVKCQR